MASFDKASIDQLVDPEGDDALRLNPKQVQHFLIGRHTPIHPEKLAELSGYALSGSFMVHGSQHIERMFYCQEVFSSRQFHLTQDLISCLLD
jgi:hypothetical protein